MNVWASCSAVSRCSTATETARISSLARGATITPPRITPVPGLVNSLTKPSRKPAILARGLVASGSFWVRALPIPGTSPASTARCETPTVAISGSVKMVAATWPSRIGCTDSPSVCHIAILPCMAATEASMSTPVQSPAAYTPGTEVLDTRSTSMKPRSFTFTPAASRPQPSVRGTMPTVIRQWLPVTARPSSRVTVTLSASRRTDRARARDSTVMPLRRNTSSIRLAASSSSCGSTLSREDTSVTREPSAW